MAGVRRAPRWVPRWPIHASNAARVPFYLRKTSTTTMTTRMSRTAPPPMYMPGTLPGRAAAHPERWAALCELYGAPQQVRAPAASMPSLSDAHG